MNKGGVKKSNKKCWSMDYNRTVLGCFTKEIFRKLPKYFTCTYFENNVEHFVLYSFAIYHIFLNCEFTFIPNKNNINLHDNIRFRGTQNSCKIWFLETLAGKLNISTNLSFLILERLMISWNNMFFQPTIIKDIYRRYFLGKDINIIYFLV